ncbi:MAG: hypothetical protein ACPGWR_06500 [Ardenticatenaceae bacterium]
MFDNTNAEIELLLAQLLGQPLDSSTLQRLLTELQHHPDPQAMLAHLESLVSWEDDPEWLQAIAAARDGFIMPEVEEFLEERDALITMAPNVVAEFDMLLAISPTDDDDLLPDFPTFAEKFEMEHPTWVQELDFQWQRIRESGQVVIQLLAQALGTSPVAPMGSKFTPIAVKGHAVGSKESDVLRRIKLEPEQTGEMDIEAVIRRGQNDPQMCTVTVRALIPSQWEWSGTLVKASAGDWQAEGATDDEGEVILEGMPENELNGLLIEVNP